jgi:hypothetical protein
MKGNYLGVRWEADQQVRGVEGKETVMGKRVNFIEVDCVCVYVKIAQ